MKPEIYETLAKVAPSIAFSASREHDPNFVWDGDGPDPEEEGFIPCDVDVCAQTICGGLLFEGHAYLGGSYFKSGERVDDCHGYLLQMMEEALVDLISGIASNQQPFLEHYANAKAAIKKAMTEAYSAQMTPK